MTHRKSTLTLVAGLVLAAAIFVAPTMLAAPAGEPGSWSGKLADADCLAATPEAPCPLAPNTKAYAIVLAGGKSAKLDSGGNAQAEAALAGKKEGNPRVAITGTAEGSTVRVKSLEVR